MNIKVEVPYGVQIVIPVTANSGQIIQGLAECPLIKEEGYGKDKTYIVATEEELKIAFLPNDFNAIIPNPIKKAIADTEVSTQLWLAEYQEHNKTKAELKLLKEKIASIEETVSPKPQEPTPVF